LISESETRELIFRTEKPGLDLGELPEPFLMFLTSLGNLDFKGFIGYGKKSKRDITNDTLVN